MRKLLLLACALLLLPAAALAQTLTVSPSQTGAVGSVITVTDPNGNTKKVVEPHIICDSGCGGSGSTAITAAAGAIVDLGTGSTPAANTVNANLKALITALGTPIQMTGGAVGLVGTLPAFASTPTFNCGTGCYQTTQPISASALPLPAGAATSANQTNAAQKTQIVDGSGNVIAATANALNVNVTATTAALNPATIYSAQQTVTTSAVALAAQAIVNNLVITALPTNSAAIYLGPSSETTSTGYPLQPGASISYGVANASAIYMLSAASTTDKIGETGN